jgi:multisubunit Na+/H+ antiporter MnhF subunit
MKKRESNDPIAIIAGGIELAAWVPLLLVLALLGFLGTVTFAVLWWVG